MRWALIVEVECKSSARSPSTAHPRLAGQEALMIRRFQTLRRAAIYASTRPQTRQALVKALEDRSQREGAARRVRSWLLVEALPEADVLTRATRYVICAVDWWLGKRLPMQAS
jgi:hypothetical protein